MAELALVRAAFPRRQGFADDALADTAQDGNFACPALGRNIEVREYDFAGPFRPAVEEQAAFQSDEGNRQVCAHGCPHHRARIAMQSRRDVEREYRRRVRIHGLHDCGKVALQGPFEAAAQKAVDNQVGLVVEAAFIPGNRATEGGEIHVGRSRIAGQVVGRGHRKHRDGDALLRRQPGDDVTVAAVIAAAADHLPALCIRESITGRRLGRGAGARHQGVAADLMILDRGSIDVSYAFDRIDFARQIHASAASPFDCRAEYERSCGRCNYTDPGPITGSAPWTPAVTTSMPRSSSPTFVAGAPSSDSSKSVSPVSTCPSPKQGSMTGSRKAFTARCNTWPSTARSAADPAC